MGRKVSIAAGILAVGLVTSILFAWGGKSGDKDATGEITSVKVTQVSVTVQGNTSDGPLWLGCTVTYKDGLEYDVPESAVEKVKGKFTGTILYRLRPQGVDSVTVALWRWKVSKKRCAKDNDGEPCQYCKKNGFHLEDRQDSETDSP